MAKREFQSLSNEGADFDVYHPSIEEQNAVRQRTFMAYGVCAPQAVLVGKVVGAANDDTAVADLIQIVRGDESQWAMCFRLKEEHKDYEGILYLKIRDARFGDAEYAYPFLVTGLTSAINTTSPTANATCTALLFGAYGTVTPADSAIAGPTLEKTSTSIAANMAMSDPQYGFWFASWSMVPPGTYTLVVPGNNGGLSQVAGLNLQ